MLSAPEFTTHIEDFRMTRIRKAIFPVAGLGTRFLPATKAMPKEMLPVVDRPLIQHVVDEARQAGIEHLIFVTGRNKSVIEDHFDRQFELELTLTERGKKAELSLLSKDLPEAVKDDVWAWFADGLEPLAEAGQLGSILLQYPRWFFTSSENRAIAVFVNNITPCGAPVSSSAMSRLHCFCPMCWFSTRAAA